MSMIRQQTRPAIRRSPGSRQRRRGLLHPLEDLIAFSQSPPGPQATGRLQRRRRQRLALAQRLLDPLPPGLMAPETSSERFWTVLRWGGLGLILARLLQP